MLPSMPFLGTPMKDISHNSNEASVHNESEPSLSKPTAAATKPLEGDSSEQDSTTKPTSVAHRPTRSPDPPTYLSPKKSSPMKHVTPILKKYNSQRKGKNTRKIPLLPKGPEEELPEKNFVNPLIPEVVMSMDETIDGEDGPQATTEPAGRTDQQSNTSFYVARLLHEAVGPSEDEDKQQMEDGSSSSSTEAEKRKRKDSEDELAALMLASTTVQSHPKARPAQLTKKKSKHLRDIESTLSFLAPDDESVQEEKAFVFAQGYFLKLKDRLEDKEAATYQEFLYTMNEFGNSIFTVVELYRRVSSVLAKHPDLVEEFLAFLLPEQAMQCGKFMEHLMLTRMMEFYRRVEVYYSKHPIQLQKIQTSLASLCTQPCVTLDDVRRTMLPLLKGNSFLINSFLELLPPEQPPESLMTDFEMLDCDGDSDHSGEDDTFETLDIPDMEDHYGGDNCSCTCHDSEDEKFSSRATHCMSCGMKFIHGKVFIQNGKVLRPAKVMFDGVDANVSIERLSVKTKPKGRSRKKPTSHLESGSTGKDIKPDDSHGDGDGAVSSASKNTSPKSGRSTKARGSGQSSRLRDKLPTKATSKTSHVESKGSGRSKSSSRSNSKVAAPAVITCPPPPAVLPPSTTTVSESTESLKEETQVAPAQPTGSLSPDNNEQQQEPEPFITETLTDPEGSAQSKSKEEDVCESSDHFDESEASQEDPQEAEVFSAESDSSENSYGRHSTSPTDSDGMDSDSNDEAGSFKPYENTQQVAAAFKSESTAGAWTKEEDKVILQMFKLDCSTEETFAKISEMLPSRTMEEIRARFDVLMKFLQKIHAKLEDESSNPSH